MDNFTASVPFKTQDAILAFSLWVAGVPEAFPPTNIYDEEILRRLGYRGIELEEAAKAAAKRGDRGKVVYWFTRTPELDYLQKAYENQQRIIQEGDDKPGGAGEAMREIMAKAAATESPMDEREALLRIVCISMKFRIPFVNRWKDETPWIKIADTGTPQSRTDGSGRVVTSYPGFKLIPVNASEELKRKMKL